MTNKSSLKIARAGAKRAFQLGTIVLALGLTACADMSGIHSQATLRDAPSLGLNGTAANAVDAQWWRAFGDEQLNALIDQALSTNPTLKVTQARLLRAQSVTEVVASQDKPQLGAGFDVTHQRFTANSLYPPPLGGSVQDVATLQLSASWELDFFGKNRAALDAALGSVRAAEADTQAARVLLAANVARSYFQLGRINDQLEVARRTLAQREETLNLVKDRVNAGLDTRLELRQSEGGLPEARQLIESLQEQASLQRNALAALTGKPDAASAIKAPTLGTAKALAPANVIPANLLAQRADITAARARVEAATHDVDSAKAQFYPNINLAAFAGLSSIGLGRLLESGSQQWGVGPAIRLPIFDGGRLRANLRGKAADLDAAVESYNAAIVDAVRDVADQVASAQSITRQQAEQVQARTAAEGAYDIAVQRYKAGLGNYLNVLTAENNVLAQRRQAVDLNARALDTQVALIRALGGGYTEPATTATTTTAQK